MIFGTFFFDDPFDSHFFPVQFGLLFFVFFICCFIFHLLATTRTLKISSRPGRLVLPWRLAIEQKRFRSKFNVTKPQKLFYERALVTKYVTPYYPRKVTPRPIWEACDKTAAISKPKPEPHPYLRLIAREVRQRFENAKMIAFLHENPIKADEKFDFTVALHRSGMTLKAYGIQILECAIGDTKFSTVLPLFCAPGCIVFSDLVKVKELQKIVRKTHQFTLMAGILEGQLLNVNDFTKYGNMHIDDVRSSLVQTLHMAGGANLNRQLNQHQSTLVTRLEQISKGESMANKEDNVVEPTNEIK